MFMNHVLKNHAERVTQEFGGGHNGIDIVGDLDLIACDDGVIEKVRDTVGDNQATPTGGNYVYIAHKHGRTQYHHLKQHSMTVKPGDVVKKGQVIGTMGRSGKSTGVHLHFEVWANGVRMNPREYLEGRFALNDNAEVVPEPVEYNQGDIVEISPPVRCNINSYGNGTRGRTMSGMHRIDLPPIIDRSYGCHISAGWVPWTNVRKV